MIQTDTVAFTKSGWKQYLHMNRCLGTRFIKGFILRLELAAYLESHEAHGASLDTSCLELHYGDGIYLMLMKSQGVWYITHIWAAALPVGFEPVFLWKCIKRGWQTFACKVLIGWRHIISNKPTGATVCCAF